MILQEHSISTSIIDASTHTPYNLQIVTDVLPLGLRKLFLLCNSLIPQLCPCHALSQSLGLLWLKTMLNSGIH